MSLNIKFSYLAENSKFSRSNSYFSILTPTFLRDGFLNSCFQNPSENSVYIFFFFFFEMGSLMTSSSSAGPIQISKFPEPWWLSMCMITYVVLFNCITTKVLLCCIIENIIPE